MKKSQYLDIGKYENKPLDCRLPIVKLTQSQDEPNRFSTLLGSDSVHLTEPIILVYIGSQIWLLHVASESYPKNPWFLFLSVWKLRLPSPAIPVESWSPRPAVLDWEMPTIGRGTERHVHYISITFQSYFNRISSHFITLFM